MILERQNSQQTRRIWNKVWYRIASFILLPGIDLDERRKRIYFAFCLLTGLPFTLVFAFVDISGGHLIKVVLDLLFISVLTVSFFVLRFHAKSLMIFRVNLALILFLILYYVATGGGDFSGLLWIYTFPPIALFLLGRREGLVWISVLFALAVILMWAHPILDTFVYSMNQRLRSAASFVLVVTLSYGFELYRERFYEMLKGEQVNLLMEKERLEESKRRLEQEMHERERVEEELQKVQKLESLGILAGGIAHGFNNVLTGILGNISLASTYVKTGETADRVSERLTEAEKASIRAKELTHRLLTFARGGAPVMQPVSIGNLLRDSAILSVSGSNVRCEFSIPDDLWGVKADEGQVNQAISNIVINAVQAMPTGGVVKVSARNTELTAGNSVPLQPGNYVKISIADQGAGIHEEHIRKIFDPFFTTDQSKSGIGLSAAYSIIKKHNGYITVESQVGSGATFHIYLPARSVPIDTGIASAGNGDGQSVPAMGKIPHTPEEMGKILHNGKGRILVMDDEKMIRDLAIEVLNNMGYEAAAAENGDKAIELYISAMEAGHPFDVAILDLTVPDGMGGEQVIQKLLKIDPEIKAVVSSGYSQDPVVIEFQRYGFSGVIEKPYKLEEMKDLLSRIMSE